MREALQLQPDYLANIIHIVAQEADVSYTNAIETFKQFVLETVADSFQIAQYLGDKDQWNTNCFQVGAMVYNSWLNEYGLVKTISKHQPKKGQTRFYALRVIFNETTFRIYRGVWTTTTCKVGLDKMVPWQIKNALPEDIKKCRGLFL